METALLIFPGLDTAPSAVPPWSPKEVEDEAGTTVSHLSDLSGCLRPSGISNGALKDYIFGGRLGLKQCEKH